MRYFYQDWSAIKGKLKGKFLFLFLDYDGTLAPIVKTPEVATISKETKLLLFELSENPCCKIAVISGRSLEDIKKKLGLNNIIYSGNHGLEIQGPQIRFVTQISESYKKTLEQIMKDLNKKISPFKGAFIEDKGFSLALHFRLVKSKFVHLVKTAFHETVILHLVKNKIKIRAGKKILEVRPILEWDKGKVVLWLLARQKFIRSGCEVFPIYIGDDSTDEDAFKALKHIGITIFVGNPKPSHAQYYLEDTNEVKEFLKRIIIMQRENICQSK